MANLGNIITDISIDRSNDIWITGADVVKYDGSVFNKYNFTNSAVPSNSPYYLDTRSISIDPIGNKWVGCATAPYVSDVIVFKLTGEYSQDSETWGLEDLGITGDSYEVSKIYSSPFGGETLAFITELNGGVGVTGATGSSGATGGYLYRYEESLNKWSEILEGYTWNHTYDIKAKGIEGNSYEYWVATEIGILIFNGGSSRVELDLLDVGNTLGSVKILNSGNSGLPSSVVYSLDFDEDGNLWIGTKEGLVFLSSEGEYKVWNSSNSDIPSPSEIFIVKASSNGQVFFTVGDGYNENGNGLFYFNGDIIVNYTESNSEIPSDQVTEIISFWKKSKNKETTYYPDEILITCLNDISLFNFITPHVYASAKNIGATGWNFIYHTPSDGLKTPKVDKYSWEYPSWRTYQDLYLAGDNPGLDRRNLFLSVPISDVADGSAGKQEYWNKSEIPDYFELKESRKIPSNTWITGLTGLTGSTDISSASNISVNVIGDIYIVGISLPAASSINLGIKADGTEEIVNNTNSTSGSPIPSEMGLIVYYNKLGQLKGYNKVRGDSTYIYHIKNSENNESVYILGGYKNNIEAGEFVYGNYPGGASGGGPIGSAIGISNINSSNIQGATGDYPWILSEYTGGTSSPFIPSWYDPSGGDSGIFIMEIDCNIGTETSLGGIDLSDPNSLKSNYFLKKFRHFPTNIDDPNFITTPKLEITKNDIKISANLGGTGSVLYTYSGENNGYFDIIGLPGVIGGNKGTLGETSIYLKLDKELNLKSTMDINSGIGPGNNVKINGISTEKSNGTSLITGIANSTSFSFGDFEIGAELLPEIMGFTF